MSTPQNTIDFSHNVISVKRESLYYHFTDTRFILVETNLENKASFRRGHVDIHWLTQEEINELTQPEFSAYCNLEIYLRNKFCPSSARHGATRQQTLKERIDEKKKEIKATEKELADLISMISSGDTIPKKSLTMDDTKNAMDLSFEAIKTGTGSFPRDDIHDTLSSSSSYQNYSTSDDLDVY